MTLIEQLKRDNYPTNLPLDGQYHRFNRQGDLSGYFWGLRVVRGAGTYVLARYGDWKLSEKKEFRGEIIGITDKEAEADSEEQLKILEQAKEKLWEEVAREVQKIWDESTSMGSTDYMARKKIPDLYGARISFDDGNTLIVPLHDGKGKIWSLQYIWGDGSKGFYPGGKIKGNFFGLGFQKPSEHNGQDKGLLCEGYATAVSLHLATGLGVWVAFNAGNLVNVAKKFREAAGDLPMELIICADDDWRTMAPIPNPGTHFARMAARGAGAEVFHPLFPAPFNRGDKDTDWNDLHVGCGIGEVKRQWELFCARREVIQVAARGMGIDLSSLRPGTFVTHKGAPRKPKDQEVANLFLEQCGAGLLTQSKDIFRYTGTHWLLLGEAELSVIHLAIQKLANGELNHRGVLGVLDLIMTGLPKPNRPIFNPDPWLANFLDGTLEIFPDESSVERASFKYNFREHRESDFLVNVRPFNWKTSENAVNQPLLDAIDKVWEGDPDKEEKVFAYQEMLGACLCSAFPHLFLLHGPAGTGKTTLILIAKRLLNQENICSVEPHEFSKFHMESMLGKLVNLVTDINTTRVIEDANIKKIEDRIPMRIQRKTKTDVYAPLPAVNIFGGNKIPNTKDGASGAHERRWTFIECSKFQATGHYNKNFAHAVFDASPEGVVALAKKGLERLLANGGHYTQPRSGKEASQEWQDVFNFPKQWVEDVQNGEGTGAQDFVEIISDAEAKMDRQKAYLNYTVWMKETNPQERILGRKEFYKAMRKLGFSEGHSGLSRYFIGLKLGKRCGASY